MKNRDVADTSAKKKRKLTRSRSIPLAEESLPPQPSSQETALPQRPSFFKRTLTLFVTKPRSHTLGSQRPLLTDAPIDYPIGLIFDLDENIVSIEEEEDQIADGGNPYISRSTGHYLSKNQDGVVEYPRMWQGEVRVRRAVAIQREIWLEIFEKIVVLNERYKKLKDQLNIKSDYLIAPIILTNATYDRHLFCQDVLMPFFRRGLISRLFPDLLHQFINRDDQLQHFARGEICNKGKFMSKQFETFKKLFGVKHKKNWLLVDDDDENVKSMEDEGFSALLHPTNPTTRPPDVTYTTHGLDVFTTLRKQLKFAEDYLIDLEKKALAKMEEKPTL